VPPPACRCPLHVALLAGAVCTGAAEQPPAGSEQFQQLARRLRSFEEGKHTPSGEPRLLHELTDSDLVALSDAAAVVGAEEPKLSGNAALRLLAWTTADARGATMALDKPLALTIGKRLDRQAQSVREKIVAIRARADAERAELRVEAAGDAACAELLQPRLRGLEASLRAFLELAHEEVYVGFNELESLLPEAETDEPHDVPHNDTPSAAQPAASATPATPAVVYRDADPEGPIPHFPWLLDEPEEGLPIPQDLAAALGPDATQVLTATRSEGYTTSAGWWSIGLPGFAKHLLGTLTLERKLHRAALADEEELAATRVKNAEARAANAEAELAVADGEIEELRGQLRQARGREEALHEVIQRSMQGQVVQGSQAGKCPRVAIEAVSTTSRQ
jgi:hypothetical protein